jgi:hypothetical protein
MIPSAIRALQMVIYAAEMLGMNPLMPWDMLEYLTLYLRLDQKGQKCPSLEHLIDFLSCIPYAHSRKFFVSLKFLMVTMTNEGGSLWKSHGIIC